MERGRVIESGMIEDPRKIDGVASVGVVVGLLLLGGWGLLQATSASFVDWIGSGYDMSEMAMPGISRLVSGASKHGLLQGMFGVLSFGGVMLVFLTRDRLRAVVAGLVICVLLIALNGIVRFAIMLPLMKMYQVVGS